ncbi:hypothetical protein PG995_013813 [Apiospora arundinis]
MRFQTPLLVAIAGLLSIASAEPSVETREHHRDFSVVRSINEARVAEPSWSAAAKEERDVFANILARNPVIPSGKNDKEQHVWTRLDSRPSTYDDRGGAKHDGLNQLMHDTGGRHVDLVIGNPHDGFHEYGLQFLNGDWQGKPNGDGAHVDVYTGAYVEVKDKSGKVVETLTWEGHIGGRVPRLENLAKSLIKGKTYNHQSFNCKTFADEMKSKLHLTK